MVGKLENRGVVKAARGFSLVELLVVIGIISLLIGIALPAFSAAKTRAKIATTAATINAISMGLETFRADEKFGGDYPPSMRTDLKANPHLETGTVKSMVAQGANLVVYALAGADLLGSAGIRDANGIDPGTGGRAPWADDLNMQYNPPNYLGLYSRYQGKLVHARNSFVDVSKMKFPPKAATSSSGAPEFELPTNKTVHMPSLTFLDSFDQPILYYRANVGQSNPFSVLGAKSGGIYDFTDNVDITGLRQNTTITGLDLGAGTGHFPAPKDPNNNVWHSPVNGLLSPATRDDHRGTFAYTIWNPNVTATVMPHNAETYILLSAGPDGLFGTDDDIANFPMNKP